MGKWLNQLRERGNTHRDHTDETDKTAPPKVSSVLSGQSEGVSNIVVNPNEAASSPSFSGSLSNPLKNLCVSDNRCGWDEEDWQAAFEERAAILQFDQGLPSQEAESLAWRQIEAQRKGWLQ